MINTMLSQSSISRTKVLPLSVDVWQVLWRSSEVFPVEMAEVQLLWLHVPTGTATTQRHIES